MSAKEKTKRDEQKRKPVSADFGVAGRASFCGPDDVRKVTKPRNRFSSKRDYGYVLIVGGSDVYSGAPALAALAALRTGAGVSFVAAPEAVANVIRSFSPDLIVYPLRGSFVTSAHVDYVRGILGRVNSVVLGPGIGTHPETRRAVWGIVDAVKEAGLPMVIDADAITSLKGNLHRIRDSRIVLTPNSGEFRAVSRLKAADDWRERAKPAMEFARKVGCTLLLKGHHTVITDGEVLRVNTTGNPGMATGGSGDVLSGIIATFLAQGQPPLLAAAAGAFVHGRAGDLVTRERGFHGMASDIVEKVPAVLKPFDRTL
jgi:NAD(P)H-hydrate epimerase